MMVVHCTAFNAPINITIYYTQHKGCKVHDVKMTHSKEQYMKNSCLLYSITVFGGDPWGSKLMPPVF